MFFVVILIIVALIIILSFIKVKTVVISKNRDIDINVYILGVIRLHKKYYIKREEKEIITLYEERKKGDKRITSLRDIIRKGKRKKKPDEAQKRARKKAFKYVIKRTYLKINLDLTMGINDAYTTAMVCGFAEVVSGAAGAVIGNKLHTINVKIMPVFSKQFISLKANCIIALSPADIIIGYVIYKKYMRR